MARDFDGSTDRIDFANTLSWVGQAQTASFWAYFDSTTSLAAYFFMDQESDESGIAQICWINSSSQLVWMGARDGSRNPSRVSNAGQHVSNAWAHYLVTWDGGTTSAGMDGFVNGTGISWSSSTDGSGTNFTGDGSMSLFGRKLDDNRCMKGRMCEFGRWSRVLSAGEIAALAAGYSPTHFMKDLEIYAPMHRSVIDHVGAAPTLDGTSVIDHPRIVYPHRRKFYLVASSGGAANAPTGALYGPFGGCLAGPI